MGIMRANYTVFPISIRNSPAAVAHLLNQVGVDHVLVGPERVSQDLANEAIRLYKAQNPSARELNFSPIVEEGTLFLLRCIGFALIETTHCCCCSMAV